MLPHVERAVEPSRLRTMTRRFTDAENTGAPLVPMIEDPAVATDGGQPEAEYLEEVIWSHRLSE